MSVDELVDLLNELARCRQEELEVRGWPDRQAGIFAMIRAVGPHPSGESLAVVEKFGPHGVTSMEHMPWRKAREVVWIINDAQRHLDILVDAYIAGDQKRALDHVRQLFRTVKAARRLGRPEEPYKSAVMARVLAGLARCTIPPRQVKVKRAIEKAAMDLGETPSDGTVKNWAREALELDTVARVKKKQ